MSAWTTLVASHSPVGWWRHGEAAGTTMVDSSGNGRNGTYAGTYALGQPPLIAGDSTTSIAPTGNAYGLIGHAAWMNFSSFTWLAWTDQPSTSPATRQSFIQRDENFGTANRFFRFDLRQVGPTDQFLFGEIFNNSGVSTQHTGTVAIPGGICMLAATYSAGTLKLYVNGVLDSTVATVTLNTTGAIPMALIGTGFYNVLNAQESVLINTALSDGDIAALYGAGVPATTGVPQSVDSHPGCTDTTLTWDPPLDPPIPVNDRLYFPSTTVAAVSPAVGAVWDQAIGLRRRKLVLAPTNTANDNNYQAETSPSAVDMVMYQYVSDPDILPLGEVEGTFSYAGKFGESYHGDALPELRVAVVSNDGSVERGQLYFGVGSGTADLTPRVCIWDEIMVNAGVIVQPGDRLVVEIGCRLVNVTSSSKQGIVQVGDHTIATDYPLVVGTLSGNRNWLDIALVAPPVWGYEVRLDADAPVDVGLINTYDFTGLEPGSAHTVGVRAYGPDGFSAWVDVDAALDCGYPTSYVTGVLSTCPQSTVTWSVEPLEAGEMLIATGAVSEDGSTVLVSSPEVTIDGPTVLTWNNPGLTNYRPALFVGCPGVRFTSNLSVTCFEDAPVDATGCLDDYTRGLHKVTVTTGPNITAKLPISTGAEAWSVQFTAVAANPNEYGAEVPYVQGFLNPAVSSPYVSPEEDAPFSTSPVVVTETDCTATVYSPVYDPTCPAIVTPPPVPSVALNCFAWPANFNRTYFTIAAEQITQWGEAVPIIALNTEGGEVRNLRLRFFPAGVDTELAPCEWVGEIVVSYIPDESTLILDGTDQVVYLEDSNGRRRADSVVFSTDGGPMNWPVLGCGTAYTVTVDLPQVSNLPFIDLSLVPQVR